MSWHLAPGLGPLLLATEAQTRSLWLFLGRANEVKVKLTWQNCWWHCWRLFRNSRTLYRPSQPRPKPPMFVRLDSLDQLFDAVRALGVVGRIDAQRIWSSITSVMRPFMAPRAATGIPRWRYPWSSRAHDPPRPGRARVAFLSYVWCGTPLTLCFHGVRDTLCIGWEVGYRRGRQSVKL